MIRKAAIYVRKSVDTKQGESIEIQINKCKATCELRDWDFEIYEDFDMSGKNTDRPSFLRMMNDVKQGKILAVVCYKLDRITRDIGDFSNFNKELERLNTDFISISDQFDTSTPMGRAMMYIAAVFAQLERETTVERVRDTMLDRARMGLWNGGKPPLGFKSERNEIVENGKTKARSILIKDIHESEIVEKIFELYLNIGSIRGVTIRLNELDIVTSNGSTWNQNQVSRVLQNAVYCISDSVAYEYFRNFTDVQIASKENEFEGNYGLIFYNRRETSGNTSKFRPQTEWILSIADHKGVISGSVFKEVQLKLLKNKSIGSRKGKSKSSPLVGLIRCGNCGSSMNVFYSHGVGYLKCRKKEQQGSHLCTNKSVQVIQIENMVVDTISSILDNPETASIILDNATVSGSDLKVVLLQNQSIINKRIKSQESEIDKLLSALGKGILPDEIISKKYREIESKIKLDRNSLYDIENQISNTLKESIHIDDIKKFLNKFKTTYTGLNIEGKSELLKSIVKEIRFDKGKIDLDLFVTPNL